MSQKLDQYLTVKFQTTSDIRWFKLLTSVRLSTMKRLSFIIFNLVICGLLLAWTGGEIWLIGKVFWSFWTFVVTGLLGSTLLVDWSERYYFESEWDKVSIGSRMRVLSSGIASSNPENGHFIRQFHKSRRLPGNLPKTVLF